MQRHRIVQPACFQVLLPVHWYRRKEPGALTGDITAQLDEHLSIRFTAHNFELQLLFDCEGCQALLSQQHGTVLLERAQEQQAQQQTATPPAPTEFGSGSSNHKPEPGRQPQQADSQPSSTGSGSAATAIAGLPGGDDMQALLARARALMAATDVPVPEVDAAADQRPDTEPAGSVSCRSLDGTQSAEGGAAGSSGGGDVGCGVSDDDDAAGDLKAMMARARAAIAANAAALQEVQV